MESLFFLVPIALVFIAIALRVLFWAINSGQYDNLDTEAHRILFDEDPKPVPGINKNNPAKTNAEKQIDNAEKTGCESSSIVKEKTSKPCTRSARNETADD